MGKFHCKIEDKWCKFLRKGVCQIANLNLDNMEKCPKIAAIETVTLPEIARKVNFDNVFPVLAKYYPDQKDGYKQYERVFNMLMGIKPYKHHRLNDLFIKVEKGFDEFYNEEYLDACGVRMHTNKNYGIEFLPWKDWVSMYIEKETLDLLTYEEIIAGCLYEMTFFGFHEDDVQNKKNELINSVEEAKNNLNNKQKCVTSVIK